MKHSTLILALFLFQFAKAQDTSRADAKLTAATVYFGYGAELTNETSLKVNSSTKQIIISQLSTSLDPNSIQISVPENVVLLSQNFMVFTPTVPVIVNPMVKKWQDSILLFQKEQAKNDNQSDIENTILEKTGRMIELTIAKTDSRAISGDDALKLINYYSAKIEKAKSNLFQLKLARNVLSEQITVLQTKINEDLYKPVKPVKSYGQLIMQVTCTQTEEIPVAFSYFTNNAGWTPQYDVRVNSKTNEIKLVYKAAVSQTTGIDWKKTKLTLSTGNPSWGGTPPILDPYYLKLYVPEIYKSLQGKVSGIDLDDVKLAEVVVTSAYGTKKEKRSLAASVQTIQPSTLQQHTTLSESQLNTNFEIDLPYDIESNGQIQSVTIKEEKINASLQNYAIPKLDRDAYLMAAISDWESLNLLPGNANIIMDNTYLGKSFIDANSTEDTLKLSLGKDRRLSIERKLMKDFTSTKTNGNNTKQVFTYEITLKNNKKTDLEVLLKDQYPISMVKEIETKLEDDGAATVDSELGILSWTLKLKPGESKKIRFSYIVKYPKDKKVEGL